MRIEPMFTRLAEAKIQYRRTLASGKYPTILTNVPDPDEPDEDEEDTSEL